MHIDASRKSVKRLSSVYYLDRIYDLTGLINVLDLSYGPDCSLISAKNIKKLFKSQSNKKSSSLFFSKDAKKHRNK